MFNDNGIVYNQVDRSGGGGDSQDDDDYDDENENDNNHNDDDQLFVNMNRIATIALEDSASSEED